MNEFTGKVLMRDYICHCFEYTESDIRDEVFENKGKSALLDRIMEARKLGTCQCDTKNPKGT